MQNRRAISFVDERVTRCVPCGAVLTSEWATDDGISSGDQLGKEFSTRDYLNKAGVFKALFFKASGVKALLSTDTFSPGVESSNGDDDLSITKTFLRQRCEFKFLGFIH